MIQTMQGIIRDGKIIPSKKINLHGANVQIKIIVVQPPRSNDSYFGKLKGTFGDGLHFQKKARKEW